MTLTPEREKQLRYYMELLVIGNSSHWTQELFAEIDRMRGEVKSLKGMLQIKAIEELIAERDDYKNHFESCDKMRLDLLGANQKLREYIDTIKATPVPNQTTCRECQETCRPGEPRCRWCLDKIYTEVVSKLQEDKKKLRAENETLTMQLVACGVAAMCNTEESMAKQQIGKENPYWSASYGDVCSAIDREIKLRAENESKQKLITHLEVTLGKTCKQWHEAEREDQKLRDELKAIRLISQENKRELCDYRKRVEKLRGGIKAFKKGFNNGFPNSLNSIRARDALFEALDQDDSLEVNATDHSKLMPKEIIDQPPERERKLELNGHGHVRPRADGVRARCGGPGICDECSREKASTLNPPPQDSL